MGRSAVPGRRLVINAYLVQTDQGRIARPSPSLAAVMVYKAKANCRRCWRGCIAFGRAGIAHCGLEPSCPLPLRDESLSLGLARGRRLCPANACCWKNSWRAKPRPGRFAPCSARSAPILCCFPFHQKAFAAVTRPILELLRLIPRRRTRIDRNAPVVGMAAASAITPIIMILPQMGLSSACCRRCEESVGQSSSPTAPVSGTRSPMLRGANHAMLRCCLDELSLLAAEGPDQVIAPRPRG